MTNAEIDRVRDLWGIRRVPEQYGEFLSLMGRGAGGILRGTDAFFPVILDMRRAGDDFFSDNPGGIDLPDGAVVFAMHQGYQVYWMESTSLQDPPVSLYMEGEAAPMSHWGSFTEFLNSEYVNTYPDF
ncbi:SMI1/KNR4 family protein [Kitasatospora sp. NPDC088351]|uniref:SMI1/KNR4 family protein n=1 Tax=unclassified Kitasatospora TaxID=2633591 RepID=UPI00342DA5C2